MANEKPKRAIRWQPRAQRTFFESITYIATQDRSAAELVALRTAQALDLIAAQPGIGTAVRLSKRRRFVIPKTGHVLEYLVQDNEIKIVRWVRQSRLRKP